MIYYTIYKTTNLINGKFYIGKHQTDNPNDRYFGSGKALLNAIKKYGKRSFKKEILYVFLTSLEMDNKEKELVTEELVNNCLSYNIGIGGEGGPHFKGKKHSKLTREKISERQIGRKLSESTRKNVSLANFKRHKEHPVSDETRKKIAERAKFRHKTMKWIHNDTILQNKQIPKNDPIEFGWILGLKFYNKFSPVE